MALTLLRCRSKVKANKLWAKFARLYSTRSNGYALVAVREPQDARPVNQQRFPRDTAILPAVTGATTVIVYDGFFFVAPLAISPPQPPWREWWQHGQQRQQRRQFLRSPDRDESSVPGSKATTSSSSLPGGHAAVVSGGGSTPPPVVPGGTSAAPGDAHYVSDNCVVFTYYSGDISSVVDEHFSRALSESGAYDGTAGSSCKSGVSHLK
ncbi:hypothetical protein MRX96_056035, partial [Rhipicephalus microplus]